MTSQEFNCQFPVGTRVKYFPIIGGTEFFRTTTRSEAWDLPAGQSVVKINGRAGGVSLDAIEIADPAEDRREIFELIQKAGKLIREVEFPQSEQSALCILIYEEGTECDVVIGECKNALEIVSKLSVTKEIGQSKAS